MQRLLTRYLLISGICVTSLEASRTVAKSLIWKREDLKQQECGGMFELTENVEKVVFKSPRFDVGKPYQPSMECVWDFRANCPLEISCPQFMMNDILCLDSISIFNETTFQKQFCGTGSKSFRGNETMTVRFRTDSVLNLPNRGFQCSVGCASGVKPTAQDARQVCGNAEKIDCSSGKFTRRIVNGHTAETNEFPWMVGIMQPSMGTYPICGGSLISDRHVLTAAHCLSYLTPKDLKIVLTPIHSNPEKVVKEIVRDVQSIHEHPDFTYYLDYDAAIIQLNESVQLPDSCICHVCLPPTQYKYDNLIGSEATTCGWGRIDTRGPLAEQLQKANLTIISSEECSERYNDPDVITPRMFCTYTKLRNVCEGDSGGPLMVKFEGSKFFTLVGITSWGSQVGCMGMPSVFTKVADLVPWIHDVIGNDRTCRHNI